MAVAIDLSIIDEQESFNELNDNNPIGKLDNHEVSILGCVEKFYRESLRKTP